MSERNLHAKAFDEGTEDKLEIYRQYLREWLPVFLNTGSSVREVRIFDFFAGPGYDIVGAPGSPVIALEEIHAALEKCKEIGRTPPPVYLYLNEYSATKQACLVAQVSEHEYFHDAIVRFYKEDFPSAFAELYPTISRPNVANLLFLDQNGVKQVPSEIFNKIASLLRTDYLFYIASSIVNRFKENPSITSPLPLTDEDIKKMNGTNVHSIISSAYQRLSPKSYLVPFSFKKKSNIYGLIFGSGHYLGAEKFLRVCWKMDKVHGAANYQMEGIDPVQPSLFAQFDKPTKLKAFESDLEKLIVSGSLKKNHDIYFYALRRGFLPSHVLTAIKSMIKNGKIPNQKLSVSKDCLNDDAAEVRLFEAE